MRDLGLRGASRGKARRTTIADPSAARAKDLVGRDFAPLAPNRLWVAAFTYVSALSGWVYVAFVIMRPKSRQSPPRSGNAAWSAAAGTSSTPPGTTARLPPWAPGGACPTRPR